MGKAQVGVPSGISSMEPKASPQRVFKGRLTANPEMILEIILNIILEIITPPVDQPLSRPEHAIIGCKRSVLRQFMFD